MPTVLLAVFVAGAGGSGTGDPSFAPGGAIPGLLGAIADFNGDRKPDLALVNSGGVRVLLGDGVGGFHAAPGSPVRTSGLLVAADLNGDGKVDLAVADGDSKNVTFLLGNGAGGFSPAPGSPVKISGLPVDIAAADLNGDGNVDLIVSVEGHGVTILLGDGSAHFAPAPGLPIVVGAEAVAVADFNGDEKPDLAVANGASKGLSILLGKGDGAFGLATTVIAGTETFSVAVADLNGDGKSDLVVPDPEGHGLTILLGDGSAHFARAPGPPITVGGGYGRRVVAVADFNGDGKPDLAVRNSWNDVSVLLGNGAGGFRPAAYSPFAVPSPSEIAAADLNGDGRPDLLAEWSCFPLGCPYEPPLSGVTILFQTPAALAVVPGRALPGRPDAIFSARGRIYRLAADDNRAAVVTTVNGTCGRVVVWIAPGRRSTSFKPGYLGCSGDGVGELALGGGQVAWIEQGGGNSLEFDVLAARLSGAAAKEIDTAFNGDRAGYDPAGVWVGQLLGGGPVLAYKLARITAGRRVVVRRGAGSYRLEAVGGGRMAVESAGAVTVLAPSGSRVATVPAMSGNPPRAIGLSRTHLAVARTFTLDLYDPATGAKAKSLPLGPAAALQLAGVNSRVALLRDSGRTVFVRASPGGDSVLRSPRRLVLVRLTDGKLISLPLQPGAATSLVDARLTEAGLFYAYNTPKASAKGRIVFEPTAKLLARF